MNEKALILIDVQKTFYDSSWGKRNNPSAEENMLKVLNFWRTRSLLVIHIQHVSIHPDSLFYVGGKGVQPKDGFEPIEGEAIFTKKVNSAFIGTNLKHFLDDKKIKEVVVAGLTTPHYVSTTTRMSGNYGFKTYLLSDGTAAFELPNFEGNMIDP